MVKDRWGLVLWCGCAATKSASRIRSAPSLTSAMRRAACDSRSIARATCFGGASARGSFTGGGVGPGAGAGVRVEAGLGGDATWAVSCCCILSAEAPAFAVSVGRRNCSPSNLNSNRPVFGQFFSTFHKANLHISRARGRATTYL